MSHPVLQCPHFSLLPNLQFNRQLEPPPPLIFSDRILRNSALAPNFCPLIHFYCRRRRSRSSYSFFKSRLSCPPLRRQSKHAPKNSVFSPDACADTYYVLALLLQQLLCSWIEQRKRNGARFTLTVAAALLMSHQII